MAAKKKRTIPTADQLNAMLGEIEDYIIYVKEEAERLDDNEADGFDINAVDPEDAFASAYSILADVESYVEDAQAEISNFCRKLKAYRLDRDIRELKVAQKELTKELADKEKALANLIY